MYRAIRSLTPNALTSPSVQYYHYALCAWPGAHHWRWRDRRGRGRVDDLCDREGERCRAVLIVRGAGAAHVLDKRREGHCHRTTLCDGYRTLRGIILLAISIGRQRGSGYISYSDGVKQWTEVTV